MEKLDKEVGQIQNRNEDLEVNVIPDLKQRMLDFEKKIKEGLGKYDECVKKKTKLETSHAFISQYKALFGKPNEGYDFTNAWVKALKQTMSNAEKKIENLSKKVNDDVQGKLAQLKEDMDTLVNRQKQLQSDLDFLWNVIHTNEPIKKKALTDAYTKVNQQLHDIYSILLPNATAKLDFVDPNDITEGVKLRVALSGHWKDGLTELSGGQKSLLAVAYIFALLRFNPCPIYILDEIDSPLDEHNTYNLSKVIKE